nr:YfjI family protein [Aureimonas psammosilenae]
MPIVSTLPAVARFVPDLLPEALRDYVFDVAERQQSAPDFSAVAALCGLASVIGNKVRIAPKRNDDWVVVPNLWGAIVGRPSAMKSPAMTAALAPAYALQDEMRKGWEEECKDIAADNDLAGLDAAEAKRKAAKALKVGERDEAKRLLREASGDEASEPPCPRLIVNDATVEKLGELLNENPNGLLLIRDELPGFLARMESEEFASDRAFYLEAFNGDGRFVYDRIGRGTVHIDNCTLSIIGGIQPSRIAPIVRGAVSGASNDGLIQRLQMTVWPDDRASWKWVDRRPSLEARQSFDAAFRHVRDIPTNESGEPTVLRFSDRAQGFFREWMEEIQREALSGALASTMESHLLKMPKTIASLALIFELVEGDGRGEVCEAATLRALEWADYLRSHAARLYSAGQTMTEDGARLIIERRRQLPDTFSARDVQRKAWSGLSDRDAVASAIEMLVATHHCREEQTQPGSTGGRIATAYAWNPALSGEG